MSSSSASGADPLSLAQRQFVDKLCLEFEDALRSGGCPRIEAFLEQVSSTESELLLSELLVIEWAYLTREGHELSMQAYLTRFIGYQKLLRRLFVKAGLTKRARLEIGSQIGRYEIGTMIGQGTFGAVYLAWDGKLERNVAIKESWADPSDSEADLERNLVEARSVAKLQHPGIVSVYDILDDAHGLPLIVMEYVEGPVLLDAVRSGSLTTAEFLRLLVRIAEAIDFAHQRGFVHRDLKPSNIRLDVRGEPRILDFGLAIHESVQGSKAGESAGSLAYMSPEQVLGRANWLDGRADIWALGVMMYEVLAERSPFIGSETAELISAVLCSEPKPLRQIRPTVSCELERICLKCLRKPLAERYSTAGDLAEDLRRFLQAAEKPVAGQSQLICQPPSRLKVRWWIAAGVIVLGGLITLWWKWQTNSVPLNAIVDLKIWDPSDTSRRGISIRDVRALPLRTGDQVRLRIAINRPAYAYVLWIDSGGKVSPVYPWESGDWQRLPKLEAKVNMLHLPATANQAWTMEAGQAGMETIVVLLRDVPWRQAHRPIESWRQLQPQTATRAAGLVEWKNGEVNVSTSSQTRSAHFGATSELIDPVVTNQFFLEQRLNDHFLLHYSLSFPFVP